MEIRVAHTAEERKEIQTLRVLVNHHELGKYFLSEEDQLDKRATLLFARQEHQVIGALRCLFTCSEAGNMNKWGIDIPAANNLVAIVDRLVVLAQFRNSRVTYELVKAIYRQALINGAKLAFVECEEHLLKLYEKLGFQKYREVNYSYGNRFQLYINPWDIESLNRVKSPFVSVYKAYLKEVNSFVLKNNAGRA